MYTRDGERIRRFSDWSVQTDTRDFVYTYTAQGRFHSIKSRKPAVAPGKFWARSSAGVCLNNTYVRKQGLP